MNWEEFLQHVQTTAINGQPIDATMASKIYSVGLQQMQLFALQADLNSAAVDYAKPKAE